MPKLKLQQQKILLEDRFFLHAYPANEEQAQLLKWWNALLPKVEFSVESRSNPDFSHPEHLEILGKNGQAIFRFSWTHHSPLMSFEDGCVELHLRHLLNPRVLQKELGFNLRSDEHFLILEEGARRTLLLDLSFLNGKARPMLREITAVLCAAVFLGHNSIEMSRNLYSALIHLHTPHVKDKQTGLEFFDLSTCDLATLEDVLDHLEPESMIIIGGRSPALSKAFGQKINEQNHTLILLEEYGAIETQEIPSDFQTHALNMSQAIEACFTLAEQASKAYFFTGLNLDPYSAESMAVQFHNELCFLA